MTCFTHFFLNYLNYTKGSFEVICPEHLIYNNTRHHNKLPCALQGLGDSKKQVHQVV